MRLGDLEIGLGECDEIGIGSRSVVRAAVHKPSNDKVAVKIYPGHGSASSDEERAELNHILHLPPHPSVVTVRSVLVENGEHLGALFGRDDYVHLSDAQGSCSCYIEVLQLCTGGELCDQLLEADVCPLPTRLTLRWFMQLAAGLAHCHAHSTCFGQLRPEHALLSSSGFVARLQRPQHNVLGGARLVRLHRAASPVEAPELVGCTSARVVDLPAADVFSLGAIGLWLFGGRREELVASKVDELTHVPRLARVLLKEMLNPDPARRPKAVTVAFGARKALDSFDQIQTEEQVEEQLQTDAMKAMCITDASDEERSMAMMGCGDNDDPMLVNLPVASAKPPLHEPPPSCSTGFGGGGGAGRSKTMIQPPCRPPPSAGYTRSGGWESLHYSLPHLVAAIHQALCRANEPFAYSSSPMPIFRVGHHAQRPAERAATTAALQSDLQTGSPQLPKSDLLLVAPGSPSPHDSYLSNTDSSTSLSNTDSFHASFHGCGSWGGDDGDSRYDYHIYIFAASPPSSNSMAVLGASDRCKLSSMPSPTVASTSAAAAGGIAYHIDVKRRYADRFRFLRQYTCLRDQLKDSLGLGSHTQRAICSPTLSGRSLREREGSFKSLLTFQNVDSVASSLSCPALPRKLDLKLVTARSNGSAAQLLNDATLSRSSTLGHDMADSDVQSGESRRSAQVGQIPAFRGSPATSDRSEGSPRAQASPLHGFKRSPNAYRKRSSSGASDPKELLPMWSLDQRSLGRL